jgi:hypothetical protein
VAFAFNLGLSLPGRRRGFFVPLPEPFAGLRAHLSPNVPMESPTIIREIPVEDLHLFVKTRTMKRRSISSLTPVRSGRDAGRTRFLGGFFVTVFEPRICP